MSAYRRSRYTYKYSDSESDESSYCRARPYSYRDVYGTRSWRRRPSYSSYSTWSSSSSSYSSSSDDSDRSLHELDLAFVIDCTGSMGPYITAVKKVSALIITS